MTMTMTMTTTTKSQVDVSKSPNSTISSISAISTSSGQKNKKLDAWEGFICGAVAGFTCRMFVAPLDVLKIRFQVQSETMGAYGYRTMLGAMRSIVKNEGGVRALWKGNIAALTMASSYTAIQFGIYQRYNNSNTNVFVVGGLSAMFATLSTYPLDLIRTRMAAEPSLYPTIRRSVTSVYTRFGVSGFYFGIVPTIVQIVPYMALNYSAYERGKAYLLENNKSQHKLSTMDGLLVGALSGTLAKLCTLPLDNVKKRMQIVGQFKTVQGSGYSSVLHVVSKIYRKEGVRAFFRGAVPSLVKAAPSSAITFAAYETTRQYLYLQQRNRSTSNNNRINAIDV